MVRTLIFKIDYEGSIPSRPADFYINVDGYSLIEKL